MSNPFFNKIKSISLDELSKFLNFDTKNINLKSQIKDIKDLINADNDCITFFHSKKYSEVAKLTKASYCLTQDNLKEYLPKNCKPIVVKNVLIATGLVTEKFYPNSIEDNFDLTVGEINAKDFKHINFGKNVLIGKNVKIGSNCFIGHNTIIEKNVHIGDNCKIGSNTIIRNTIIKNNVSILDNCIIGKKGFGFFQIRQKILDTHILEL